VKHQWVTLEFRLSNPPVMRASPAHPETWTFSKRLKVKIARLPRPRKGSRHARLPYTVYALPQRRPFDGSSTALLAPNTSPSTKLPTSSRPRAMRGRLVTHWWLISPFTGSALTSATMLTASSLPNSVKGSTSGSSCRTFDRGFGDPLWYFCHAFYL
jgi:hypothetical protein